MAVRLQNSFHAGRPLMEEKKEEAETKLLTLENPYQSIPFAIVLAIPAIANEVYIMNEETQLFVCFGLFVGSVYSLAGDAIVAALDEKGQAIMAEHHALEDVQISAVQVVKEAHLNNVSIAEDVAEIHAAEKELLSLAINTAQGQLQHQIRGEVDRKLKQVANAESSLAASIQTTVVSSATAGVTASFVEGGAKSKADALDYAMSALAGKASGKDAIGEMFSAQVASANAKLTAMKAAPVALSADQQAALAAELDTISRREHLEGVKVTVPTTIEFA